MSDFNPTTSLLTYGDMLAVFKLYYAIGKASAEFADVPKNTAGQYGNQTFSYAPYHVLRKCIIPALTKYGVSVMQPTHTEGDKIAITLIVSGHEAAISSTILFKADQTSQNRFTKEVKFDVQLFGREHTYWRRYQLQSFFCLEGDKDADDIQDMAPMAKPGPSEAKRGTRVGPSSAASDKDADDPPEVAGPGAGTRVDTSVPSSKGSVSKPTASNSAEILSPKEQEKVTIGNSVVSATGVFTGGSGNGGNANSNDNTAVAGRLALGGDKRTLNEKLLDAKKQLNWEIPKDFDVFAKEHIEEFPDYVTATKMTNEHKATMWRLLVEHKNVIPW